MGVPSAIRRALLVAFAVSVSASSRHASNRRLSTVLLDLPPLSSADAPQAAHDRMLASRDKTTVDFIHIHKCYGTNFLYTMIPYFCPERQNWEDPKSNGIASENCLFYANYSSVEAEELTNGKRFRFISDERPASWRAWTPATVKAVLLRDPLDRAVSDYEYLIWHDHRFPSNQSISHYLELPYSTAMHNHIPAFYFHNHQNRMLLGNGFGDPVLKGILKKLGEMHSGPCLDAAEMDAMKQHLWRFHFLGIASQPGLSNCLFAWTIGNQAMIDDLCKPVKLETVVTQENARNDSWTRLRYTPRDYVNIAKANRCDLELYALAQDVFYERVAQLLDFI